MVTHRVACKDWSGCALADLSFHLKLMLSCRKCCPRLNLHSGILRDAQRENAPLRHICEHRRPISTCTSSHLDQVLRFLLVCFTETIFQLEVRGGPDQTARIHTSICSPHPLFPTCDMRVFIPLRITCFNNDFEVNLLAREMTTAAKGNV